MNTETLKELLANATPGPWRVFGKMTGKIISENAPGWVEIGTIGDFDDDELVPFNAERWNADARLIAAAPYLAADNIALQAEVERLRKALSRLEDANDAVAGQRTREMYLAMIEAGQDDILDDLDEARRNARAARETQETLK